MPDNPPDTPSRERRRSRNRHDTAEQKPTAGGKSSREKAKRDAQPADREARLAAALRENLKRRKAPTTKDA
ncbi:MAG: hypothetical protein AAGB02_00925 [Pseudomonadota bacterium]